jgi:hypothetical protein
LIVDVFLNQTKKNTKMSFEGVVVRLVIGAKFSYAVFSRICSGLIVLAWFNNGDLKCNICV